MCKADKKSLKCAKKAVPVQWGVNKPSGNLLNIIIQHLKCNSKIFLEDFFHFFFFLMIVQFWLLESADHAVAAVMFSFLKSSFLKSYHWDSGYFNCHFKCWVGWKSWQTQRMFESIPNVTGRYHCMDTWEEHT